MKKTEEIQKLSNFDKELAEIKVELDRLNAFHDEVFNHPTMLKKRTGLRSRREKALRAEKELLEKKG